MSYWNWVWFFFFFCLVFLVCYCFFHIRTSVPRITVAFPSIPIASRGGRPQSGLPSCTERLQWGLPGPSFCQAEHSQLPFFIADLLQPFEHLHGSPLDPFKQLHVLLVLSPWAWTSGWGLTEAKQRRTIPSLPCSHPCVILCWGHSMVTALWGTLNSYREKLAFTHTCTLPTSKLLQTKLNSTQINPTWSRAHESIFFFLAALNIPRASTLLVRLTSTLSHLAVPQALC